VQGHGGWLAEAGSCAGRGTCWRRLPCPSPGPETPSPGGFVCPQKSLNVGNNTSLLTSADVSLKIFQIFCPEVSLVMSLRDNSSFSVHLALQKLLFPFAEIIFHLKKVSSFKAYDHSFKR